MGKNNTICEDCGCEYHMSEQDLQKERCLVDMLYPDHEHMDDNNKMFRHRCPDCWDKVIKDMSEVKDEFIIQKVYCERCGMICRVEYNPKTGEYKHWEDDCYVQHKLCLNNNPGIEDYLKANLCPNCWNELNHLDVLDV